MITIPPLVDFMKAGVHFGHAVAKRHPKMSPSIFTARNGVHIIDLEKTVVVLQSALEFVHHLAASGQTIVFVGSKRQAQEIVKKAAIECGMPYVTTRWLGGTITNFSVLKKLLKKYHDLTRKREKGELTKYTKKEQLEFEREIIRLEESVGGIANLEKIPDALFVVDIKHEETAVREALKKKIPIVAMCDTNVNPTGIAYCIPANDDATKSIELITSLVAAAAREGTAYRKEHAVAAEVKAAPATEAGN
ncbi:30S ribosomal protein S2 [Candidatus Uhrbacteria bacterium]|nr:30S ribosomal protein S2 [Candidatus Uhrbacteria bacterium]